MCKSSLMIAGLIFGLVLVTIYFYRTSYQQKTGTVIILNGPSGSGKTSAQKAFQQLMMPELWIKLGVDSLFDLPLPDISLDNMSYWQQPNNIRWVNDSLDQDDHKIITLLVGKDGEKVVHGMNSAIAAYAKSGCNVIVDYIAYDQAWLEDLQYKLKDIKTYYVAVDIPLDILEQREASRGTSPVGHARSHYHTVYGNQKYDFRIDTSKNSTNEVAAKLKELLAKP